MNFAMAEQIEDLNSAHGDAAYAEGFFKRNHITQGQHQLLEIGLKRLDGRDPQGLFELTQAMGGGKTHSMIAFGLLARHPALRTALFPQLAERLSFGGAKVVTFSGRNNPDHFVWGEIAAQLGKAAQFERFWRNGPQAPDEAAWVELLGETPTLILLDELPPYLENALTRAVGAGNLAQATVYALSSLFSAALKRRNVCIVLSNLSGTYQGSVASLHQIIRNLEGEARRQAKAITPVELGSDEIYQILKKRLFDRLPAQIEIDRVADGFGAAISEAQRGRSIGMPQEQIAEGVRNSYPFHPSIKDVIALFKNNESFRQTRGLMQFVAGMIRSVWNRPNNDVHLIGLQHLNLNDADVRDEINRISDLRNAIAHDVAAGGPAVAEMIDVEKSSDSGSQVAALLLSSSLSSAVDAVKGLTRQRLLEILVAPQRDVLDFADAFDKLKAEAWYLHKDQSEAYYFANNENLTKRLSMEAERAPANKVDKELRRRLEEIFGPRRKAAYQILHALPKIDEVDLKGERVLLILSPDSANPPAEAKAFYESVTEKNNVCILTGDTSNLASLEDKTRMIYAVAKVKAELVPSDPKQADLDEKMEQAEFDFNTTVTAIFNRIWYPLQNGLVGTNFAMTFDENKFDGEEQIEKTLSEIRVSKLQLDVEADVSALFSRAEQILWSETSRRIPWRDFKLKAITNPRWKWLPKDGLETLRKLAQAQDRWRYSEDGFLERGPFEKAKTDVVFTELHRDETGLATLEVIARDAGNAPQIYWDTKATVSAASGTRLTDKAFRTKAVRVWFVAVDPQGAHETGPARDWSNKLTIKHEVKGAGNKRLVELEVIPSGTIRYTLNGSNPAEGTVYTAPIEVGADEATVYCYAEAENVNERRTVQIPKAGDHQFAPDPLKPAKLSRRFDANATADVFALTGKLKAAGARASQLQLDVGQGDKNVTVRFGSGAPLRGEDLEETIKFLRQRLGNEMAEVRLMVRTLAFGSGHDLVSFSQASGFELDQVEVEQQ